MCVTPLEASTAGCPQRSGGTQTVGSPFFCLLFFGEAKKSESPAAATERHQDSAKNQVRNSTQGFDRLSPILRYACVPCPELVEGSGRTGQGFDRLSPNGDGDGSGSGHAIRKRAFSGSEHKFPAPSARPSGASQRNCDPTPKTRRCGNCASLRNEIVIRPQKPGCTPFL